MQGGLVTTDEQHSDHGHGHGGQPSVTSTQQPASQQPTPTGDLSFSVEESAFDVWFQDQPFNRDDVIVFAALASLAILAYTEMNQ